MGELPLHVTVRDDRPLSAPFTSTASVPGLERWDRPVYIIYTNMYIHIIYMYYSIAYYNERATSIHVCHLPVLFLV